MSDRKNIFAWLEICLSVILLIVALMGYFKMKNIDISDFMQKIAEATDSYKQVVSSNKTVFEQAYNTIPQHKKTLKTACEKIENLKQTCDATENYIRENSWLNKNWKWVQKMLQLPQKIYQPCGELKKSFELSISVLETLDDNKKQEFLTSFDETIQALDQASLICRQADSQINSNAFYFLLTVLLMSLCFLTNGIAVLFLENTKKESL